MTVHMSNEILAPNMEKSISWEELRPTLRKLFELNGTQEIVTIETNEEGITLKVKDHEKAGRSSSRNYDEAVSRS